MKRGWNIRGHKHWGWDRFGRILPGNPIFRVWVGNQSWKKATPAEKERRLQAMKEGHAKLQKIWAIRRIFRRSGYRIDHQGAGRDETWRQLVALAGMIDIAELMELENVIARRRRQGVACAEVLRRLIDDGSIK